MPRKLIGLRRSVGLNQLTRRTSQKTMRYWRRVGAGRVMQTGGNLVIYSARGGAADVKERQLG